MISFDKKTRLSLVIAVSFGPFNLGVSLPGEAGDNDLKETLPSRDVHPYHCESFLGPLETSIVTGFVLHVL